MAEWKQLGWREWLLLDDVCGCRLYSIADGGVLLAMTTYKKGSSTRAALCQPRSLCSNQQERGCCVMVEYWPSFSNTGRTLHSNCTAVQCPPPRPHGNSTCHHTTQQTSSVLAAVRTAFSLCHYRYTTPTALLSVTCPCPLVAVLTRTLPATFALFLRHHLLHRTICRRCCTVSLIPQLDPSLPVEQRVSSFIANLTLDEKINLTQNGNAPIPRISLPNYDWWSEASHGIAWGGKATVFPSPIALAATWNSALMYSAGRVIGNEARGRYNDYRRQHGNDSTTFYGLNFYAPNINMFVHSQWGRGQETFGEAPVLSGQLTAAQYVMGVQGNVSEAEYLQAGATAKHFALFSGWVRDLTEHGVESNPGPFEFNNDETEYVEVYSVNGRVHFMTYRAPQPSVRDLFCSLQAKAELIGHPAPTGHEWGALEDAAGMVRTWEDPVGAGKYKVVATMREYYVQGQSRLHPILSTQW